MRHLLGEMTWDEAKKAYLAYDFVALVTGSHEQHSFHLPLLSDSIIGEYFAKRLVEEAERRENIKILLLPTLWLGYSGEHTNFPAHLHWNRRSLESIVLDIARWLQAAWRETISHNQFAWRKRACFFTSQLIA